MRESHAESVASHAGPSRAPAWSGDTILNYALDVGSLWRYRFDMPRLARVVVPGVPHHVTQRGNRRQGYGYRLRCLTPISACPD